MASVVWKAPNNMDSQNAIKGTNSVTCPEANGGQETPREEAEVSRGISQEEFSGSALLSWDKRFASVRNKEDSPRI